MIIITDRQNVEFVQTWVCASLACDFAKYVWAHFTNELQEVMQPLKP